MARDRQTHTVEHDGKQVRLAELAKVVGINYFTLYERHQRGDVGARLIRKTPKQLRAEASEPA